MEIDLDEMYGKYKNSLDDNNNRITEKQITYIKFLINYKTNNDNVNDDYYIGYIQQLGFNINNWDELDKKVTNTIIKKIKNSLPATDSQIKKVKSMNSTLVNNILSKSNKCINDLTFEDIDNIFSVTNAIVKNKDVPIISNELWEYGYQHSKLCKDNKLYYIKFFNMLMIDYDNSFCDSVLDDYSTLNDCATISTADTDTDLDDCATISTLDTNTNTSTNFNKDTDTDLDDCTTISTLNTNTCTGITTNTGTIKNTCTGTTTNTNTCTGTTTNTSTSITTNTNESIVLNKIRNILSNITYYDNHFTFRLYKTYNGYHAFCTSAIINYNNKSCIHLMRKLLCDDIYTKFIYKQGFKIRLSKKIDRDEPYIAKYIETIGNEKELPLLIKLINIHDEYITKHLDD